MPSGDQSWAHQMDMDDDLDDRRVEYDGDMKILTEIRTVNGKKIQVKQYLKTEKRRVSVNVAKRKMWRKFGLSENDPPGPNPKTTFISDEIQMEFLNAKEEDNVDKLAAQANKNFDTTLQCRICGHNHWTIKCPFSTEMFGLDGKLNPSDSTKAGLEDRIRGRAGLSLMRDGRRVEMGTRGKDENNTIRITNLPEETQDSDIRDLFKDFGRIVRIFLAKDKATGNSKGFAFVSFDCRENAAKAIKAVNGHGYNNLILSVEWARPSGN